jgi:F-type H+-transporting ATPase subunit epsilon
MAIRVEIVTPDRKLFSGDVDMVTLPGSAGQMGILRGHAPLLSTPSTSPFPAV